VFNDGAFDALRDKKQNAINAIRLEHGQPILFNGGTQQVARRDGSLQITDAGDGDAVVHDAHTADPSHAFALSRLSAQPTGPTPIGVFRDVSRAVFGEDFPRERAGAGPDALDALLNRGDVWTVT
jgi:2-oxoglutarate ferredoxin oxidoreductase subunit beta